MANEEVILIKCKRVVYLGYESYLCGTIFEKSIINLFVGQDSKTGFNR